MLEVIPRGEDRKHLSTKIKQETTNKHNRTLTLFCQGSKPNDSEGTLTGTAVCVAWQFGREIRHTTKLIGPNASTADAAHEAILLATSYIHKHLQSEEHALIEICSTDANVARDCLKSNSRNHHVQIENLVHSLSDILGTHPLLQINLGWLPAAKGSIPL